MFQVCSLWDGGGGSVDQEKKNLPQITELINTTTSMWTQIFSSHSGAEAQNPQASSSQSTVPRPSASPENLLEMKLVPELENPNLEARRGTAVCIVTSPPDGADSAPKSESHFPAL